MRKWCIEAYLNKVNVRSNFDTGGPRLPDLNYRDPRNTGIYKKICYSITGKGIPRNTGNCLHNFEHDLGKFLFISLKNIIK